MVHTQAAHVEPSLAPRIALGAELRLANVSAVIEAIDRILYAQPHRIELDASKLRFMTEGARRVLLVATSRLAVREIDLVIVGCEPFD